MKNHESGKEGDVVNDSGNRKVIGKERELGYGPGVSITGLW